MKFSLIGLLALTLVLSLPASAAEGDAKRDAQVTIRPGEDGKVFHEYRVNGEVVEIKVVPKVGPPYYLVPADGEGYIRLDRSQLLVPKWILFRW